MKAIERKEGYSQVCVWPGTLVGPDKIADFENFMLEEFKARVQYLEEINTYPDLKDGKIVDGTGGRTDLFFSVHQDDIGHFAIPRLQMGIRWFEDSVARCNGGNQLYPTYVMDYYSWAKEEQGGPEDES
jgi:hypothetical protein